MSNFAQYTNGVVMPTGIDVAGANIGKFAQQGLQNMSQGLAEGIQAYHTNKALSDQADQEAEMLAPQVAMTQHMLESTPEYAGLAGEFAKHNEGLQDIHTKSLSQKLAILNSAKASLGAVTQKMQFNELITKSRLANYMPDAEREAQGKNITINPYDLPETQYDPRLTYQKNVDNLLATTNKIRSSNPNVTLEDDATIIAKWHNKQQQAVAGSKLPDQVKASVLDQMAKAKNYGDNTNRATDWADPNIDWGSEVAGWNAKNADTGVDALKSKIAGQKEKPIDIDAELKKWTDQKNTAGEAIAILQGKGKANIDAYTKDLANWKSLVEQDKVLHQQSVERVNARHADLQKEYDSIPDKIDRLQSLADTMERRVQDKDGNMIPNPHWLKLEKQIENLRKRRDEISDEVFNPIPMPTMGVRPAPNIDDYRPKADTSANAPANIQAYAGMATEADKKIEELNSIKEYNALKGKTTEELKTQLKELQDQKDKINSTAGGYDPFKVNARNKDWMDNLIEKAGQFYGEQFAEIVRDASRKDENGNISVTYGGLVNKMLRRYPPSYLPSSIQGRRLLEKYGIIGSNLTDAEKQKVYGEMIQSLVSDDSIIPMSKEGKIAAIDKQIANINNIINFKAPAKEKTAEEKQLASIAPVKAGSLNVGSEQTSTDLTIEQKKVQVEDFMRKKFGYVPSSFSQFWTQAHPESQMKVMHTEAGDFYWDGKEIKPVPVKNTIQNQEATAKFAGRIYNNDEIAVGSGIYARGTINGDKPAEFKKELTATGEALRQIDALKTLMTNASIGRSLNPVARAEAQKYVSFLKSAVRPELFPSGRVAEWEQKILDQLVPDPSGVFTLDASTTKALDVLREQVMNNIRNAASNRGVSLSFTQDSQGNMSEFFKQERIRRRLGN